MASNRTLLGIKKAAQTLNLSETRVRQLADSGEIPCTRDGEGRRQFDRAALLESKKTRSQRRARQASVEA